MIFILSEQVVRGGPGVCSDDVYMEMLFQGIATGNTSSWKCVYKKSQTFHCFSKFA